MFLRNSAKIIKNGTSEKKSGRSKLDENTRLSRSKRDVWSRYRPKNHPDFPVRPRLKLKCYG